MRCLQICNLHFFLHLKLCCAAYLVHLLEEIVHATVDYCKSEPVNSH